MGPYLAMLGPYLAMLGPYSAMLVGGPSARQHGRQHGGALAGVMCTEVNGHICQSGLGYSNIGLLSNSNQGGPEDSGYLP